MKNDVFTILSKGFIFFLIHIVRKNTPYKDYSNQLSGGLD